MVDALFPLGGGRREGKKEKKKSGEEGLPGAEPALLAVPWVADVICN
jgi:hypothetical protein